MRDKIEAKLKQARQQLAAWQQQQQAQAAEQVARWDAVGQACEELLTSEEKSVAFLCSRPHSPPVRQPVWADGPAVALPSRAESIAS